MADLDDIAKLVSLAIEEVTKKENLEEAAIVAIERIKKRTRLGKGVTKPLAEATPLKKLEPSTVRVRKSLKSQGKLTGPGAKPSKSGINRTGKTLDGIFASAKTGQVEIELRPESQRVAEELLKIDSQRFQFMNLSKAEVKVMIEILQEKVQKLDKRLK